jgi:hypothetical protein
MTTHAEEISVVRNPACISCGAGPGPKKPTAVNAKKIPMGKKK